MSAVSSKFYNKNQADKSKQGSSAEPDGTSMASVKSTETFSTTSSNVSQHSEDRDEQVIDDDEEEGGDWGEMEVSWNYYHRQRKFDILTTKSSISEHFLG